MTTSRTLWAFPNGKAHSHASATCAGLARQLSGDVLAVWSVVKTRAPRGTARVVRAGA